MESTIIRPAKNAGYANILSVATFLVGTVVLGLLACTYVNNTLAESWIFSLAIGLGAVAVSLSIRYRHLFVEQPELRIDKDGITSQNTSVWGDKSVKWDDVKAMSLGENAIRIQYQKSGSHDKVHLPEESTQKHSQIDHALSEAASLFDIAYNRN
ncbi:hypothetical protein CRI93_05885 [Longimonas halophila]|uniref:YcxB-like protein domain-containing protein n=1 Tax=Longimonas halophila TaxID=1469170 RepID=A0A2H3NQM3_9BACT|nr:hypothetical protein [Longimonas halophila]PEN07973.1 hypothetical protein CRI93_05885 [Longimonas halophila]